MALVVVPRIGKENTTNAVLAAKKPSNVPQAKRLALNHVQNNLQVVNQLKGEKTRSTLDSRVPVKDPVKVARVQPFCIVSSADERLGNLIQATEVTSTEWASEYLERTNLTSYSSRLLPDGVRDIDTTDNICLCPKYAADIYDYLRESEISIPISDTFVKKQKQVTSRMRNILVDWLVQVHLRFDLLVETLYLAVSILDRYLDVQRVTKENFQLVGITATLIACKYEEVYFPEIKDFVRVTDGAYTKKKVLEMEIMILTALDFVIGRPLPIQFLRRLSRAADSDLKTHATAKYVMELSLVDSSLSCSQPSLIAASAFYIAKKALHPKTRTWDAQLSHYSGYRLQEILPVVRKMSANVLSSGSGVFKSIFEKYGERKNLKVSSLPQLKSEVVIKLSRS